MNKPNHLLQNFLLFVTAITGTTQTVLAATPSAEDFASSPSILSQNVAPMVLFGMSNDHQLFYKAYTDYDDLDNDGTIDTKLISIALVIMVTSIVQNVMTTTLLMVNLNQVHLQTVIIIVMVIGLVTTLTGQQWLELILSENYFMVV